MNNLRTTHNQNLKNRKNPNLNKTPTTIWSTVLTRMRTRSKNNRTRKSRKIKKSRNRITLKKRKKMMSVRRLPNGTWTLIISYFTSRLSWLGSSWPVMYLRPMLFWLSWWYWLWYFSGFLIWKDTVKEVLWCNCCLYCHVWPPLWLFSSKTETWVPEQKAKFW